MSSSNAKLSADDRLDIKVNAGMDRNTVLWAGDPRATRAGPKVAANASPA